MTAKRPLRKPPKPVATSARPRPATSAGTQFPIVGIGASAGGLEAFTELLKNLPLDTGMAFVLVQHLDPQHESALAQILARATRMPVREVTDNRRVQANRVYVIPPNTSLGIAKGVLKLQPRVPSRTPHHSIDLFLESLAQDQHEQAIGVILSGTATDGTLGLEAIKAEGGITFAQDESARYDSMPRSAIAEGCVDFVLSPSAIARELARIARHPYLAGPVAGPGARRGRAAAMPAPASAAGLPADTGKDAAFKKILLLLRTHSGVDFSLYKSSTIQRRVSRRCVLNKSQALEDYADFLRGNAKELDALYADVLISVTGFFRNPDAFELLKNKVFAKLALQRSDEPFRVWSLGCSTGQEAYSIAMAYVECADKAPQARKLQVFATDLNEALLEKARHGFYAKNLALDLSPERLRRFFVEEEGGYRVVKSLREMVVFARHNLIGDPPFSRMDLISCRNVLIYLEPALQQRALPTFHYALKPGGFLFLGASESIGTFAKLFEPADRKHRIFAKRAAAMTSMLLPVRKVRSEPVTAVRPATPGVRRAGPAAQPEGFHPELIAQREADRVAVNQFAPPSVLINDELQILQFRGPTGAYLEPPTGKASFDLLKMAREGLKLPLRALINKARKEGKAARHQNVRLQQDDEVRPVNVEVIPLKNLRERCFLVVFEDARKPSRAAAAAVLEASGARRTARPGTREESRRIAALEADLGETRDYMQSIQDQYEAANEELQASNEEVQSANEELQSLNEELETSKEELESANEELTTVNEEMGARNTELSRLNSDLLNLQASARLAILVLNRDLTIRRFSPQATRLFDLTGSDVGRPIGHVRHRLDVTNELEGFIGGVIADVREREREVRDANGHWYSLRVHPYFTADNKVDGAVLVLVDIDALKQTEQIMGAARDYAELIIHTVREPLLILHPDLRVHRANEAFYSNFRISPARAQDQLVYTLDNGQWDIPALHELLEEILPRDGSCDNFAISPTFESIGKCDLMINARRLRDARGQPGEILLDFKDVTARGRREGDD
ncbi:MAG TPA: chemotaxis protein CheB [Candidatus Binatia bacterium]|nr:chemotaxis protein CheB [Candidatus Binatia bacterium]